MKIAFIKELKNIALKDKNVFFLTGDLGFNAFEDIRDSLGERFINAGVAEQNMISVAAGLAAAGLEPWVHSIASFLTLKTVEQVRNDICHNNLRVKLMGFGGGYGYGIMGETHHILEDIAIYSALPNIKIYVPAFSEDIPIVVSAMHNELSPSYVRLNLVPKTTIKLPQYSAVRQVSKGDMVTVIVLGPLVHNVLLALSQFNKEHIADVFCISELPIKIPHRVFHSIEKNKRLLIVEEHTSSGGLGEIIFSSLGKNKFTAEKYIHLFAKGYISHRYGDHAYHQTENDLNPAGIYRNIKKLLR